MRYSQRHFLEIVHEISVDTAACEFVKDFRATRRELDGLKFSNRLFSIRPKSKSITGRPVPIAQVATSHIDELILKATIKADATERIAFHRSLRQDKSFRPTAGYILKNFVLAWLSAHPLSTPIPCTAAMTSAPRLEIPVCPKDRSIPFTDLGSMRDMNTPPTPLCLLTVSQTCAASAVDAIVCSDEAIITVQVTISRRHGATPSSFEQIRAQLPVLFGEARWLVGPNSRTLVRNDRREGKYALVVCDWYLSEKPGTGEIVVHDDGAEMD